jgi:hypothetical protein
MLTGVPATIPAPLPKWSRWAIELTGATSSSYLVSFLEFLGQMGSTSDPAAGEWRHVQVVYTDAITNEVADEMVITFDIANITNGGIDSSWTAADYQTCDVQFDSLLGAWGAHMDPHVVSKEVRYYRRAFNPYSDQKPFPPSGPPEHVHPFVQVGTATSSLPHQLAVTHSEKTTYPRHWGRVYWPALGYATTAFANGGVLATGFVDAWAGACSAFYDNLMSQEFFPCVPTTQVNKVPSRQLLGIQAIQVDDVADIIRRRRRRSPSYKVSTPVS